jgi:hypothetical protein
MTRVAEQALRADSRGAVFRFRIELRRVSSQLAGPSRDGQAALRLQSMSLFQTLVWIDWNHDPRQNVLRANGSLLSHR